MADVAAMMQAGERAVAAGQWGEARKWFSKVVARHENPAALVHLSYLESKTGSYRRACDFAVRAFRIRKHPGPLRLKVLNRLRHFNQTWALHSFIEGTSDWERMDPRELHAFAAQASYLGSQQRAIQLLDLALRKQPASPPLLLARAQIRTFLGQFDEAEEDLQACMGQTRDMAAIWWTLARLRKQTHDSNHVDDLRRELGRQRPASERAFLQFALHKELDDLGDIPGASEALTAGCATKRSEISYSTGQSRSLMALLKSSTEAVPVPEHGADLGFTPIFIVGMFRSGTTLLEQLLGGNARMLNAGELYDFGTSMRYAADHQTSGFIDEELISRAGAIDFGEVAAQYVKGVKWRLQAGQTHLTDKLPANFYNVGYILRALPQARILHMVRDPVETCFSNLRELFSGASPYSYDQGELADFYLMYEDLMAHWHRQYPGRVLDIHYSDLTTRTEEVMRKVAAHCGLDFLPTMVDPRSNAQSVATASAVQVRSPVIARAVPKWEPYRGYLQPLIHRLGRG
ncbi:tetratricopeptide repeat-containing sulfotransferase family protein [Pseudoxanthomonas sp. 10H]|uniref:tetratricopeptide repeat-containing sulfotransferase family protein n=1 Tax=Pseudoxanthomonas sp. 10H TaxID=3242729 RepID=UPI003557FC5D